jgi:hypothetical protein
VYQNRQSSGRQIRLAGTDITRTGNFSGFIPFFSADSQLNTSNYVQQDVSGRWFALGGTAGGG